MKHVGMILMVGGGGRGSAVERTLRQARQAAARDLIDQAARIPALSPLIVLSDEPEWLATLEGLPVQREIGSPGEPFHFGRTLTGLLTRYRLERCLYLGGGSAPLLDDVTLAQVVEKVQADAPLLITNNLHSTDWAAFAPADALSPLVPWLERDNALAWVWQEKTGYPVHALPRATFT